MYEPLSEIWRETLRECLTGLLGRRTSLVRMTSDAPATAPRGGLVRLPGRDLFGIRDVGVDEVCRLLASARALSRLRDRYPRARGDVLAGCTVVNLFGEPSTRTRMSFSLAARVLGAEVLEVVGEADTSRAKGETAFDTACTLDAMGVDVLVIRDREEQFPERVGERVRARVVNAGDGCNEHPTQALLDALTLIEAFARPIDGSATLRGMTVAICGDIAHGRVAHSNLSLLPALGADVRVTGPAELVPGDVESRYGVARVASLDEAITGVNAIIMLRVQAERFSGAAVPEPNRYRRIWGLDSARLAKAASNVVVMHPGPVIRGMELTDELADGPRSRVLRQVALGVSMRMAVLARACNVELAVQEDPQEGTIRAVRD